jgi:hypothetical protein
MFIFNNSPSNLPYSFEDAKPSSATGILLSSLLDDPATKPWQNNDYKSCEEICKAGKSVGD